MWHVHDFMNATVDSNCNINRIIFKVGVWVETSISCLVQKVVATQRKRARKKSVILFLFVRRATEAAPATAQSVSHPWLIPARNASTRTILD